MRQRTYKEPRGFYARKFGRSITTIDNWTRDNAPLDDDRAMAIFMRDKDAARKTQGAPVNERVREGSRKIGRPKSDPNPPPPGEALVGGKTQYQLKTEELSLKLERSRFAFAVEKAEYVKRSEEREAGIVIATELETELKRIQSEFPSKCAGLGEVELLEKITEYHNRLVHNLREKLIKLNLSTSADE